MIISNTSQYYDFLRLVTGVAKSSDMILIMYDSKFLFDDWWTLSSKKMLQNAYICIFILFIKSSHVNIYVSSL